MKILFLLVFLLSPFSFIQAEEEPALGRDAEGRAYRTNEDGFQVVDYLAELEMTVEEQKRQILALKNELAASSKEVAEPLEEKNLITGEIKKSQPVNNDQVLGLQNKVGLLTHQINQKDDEINKLTAEIETLRSKAEKANSELSVVKASLNSAEKEQFEATVAKSEITELNKTLSIKTEQINQQNIKIKKLEKEVAGLQNNTQQIPAVQKDMNPAGGISSVASARSVSLSEAPKTSLITTDKSRSRAFEVLQGNIRSDLNQAITLDKERISLYETYRKNPKSTSLAFNLTPAKTSEGITLESLPGMLNESRSFADLSKAQKALLYISKAVKSDVELLKRLIRQ